MRLLVDAARLAVHVGLVVVRIEDLQLVAGVAGSGRGEEHAAVAARLAGAGDVRRNPPLEVQLVVREAALRLDVAGRLVDGQDAVGDRPLGRRLVLASTPTGPGSCRRTARWRRMAARVGGARRDDLAAPAPRLRCLAGFGAFGSAACGAPACDAPGFGAPAAGACCARTGDAISARAAATMKLFCIVICMRVYVGNGGCSFPRVGGNCRPCSGCQETSTYFPAGACSRIKPIAVCGLNPFNPGSGAAVPRGSHRPVAIVCCGTGRLQIRDLVLITFEIDVEVGRREMVEDVVHAHGILHRIRNNVRNGNALQAF